VTVWAAPNYTMTLLAPPPGTQWVEPMHAPAVNNSHQIAIDYFTGDNTWQPYLWTNGNFTPLALPAGFTSGGATAINNVGTVVGFAGNPFEGPNVPVAWNNGVPT